MGGMASVRSRPPKTVEDFLALGEDVLAELIDGEIYVMASPGLICKIWLLFTTTGSVSLTEMTR